MTQVRAVLAVGEVTLTALKTDIVAWHKLSELGRFCGHSAAATALASIGSSLLVSSNGLEVVVVVEVAGVVFGLVAPGLVVLGLKGLFDLSVRHCWRFVTRARMVSVDGSPSASIASSSPISRISSVNSSSTSWMLPPLVLADIATVMARAFYLM